MLSVLQSVALLSSLSSRLWITHVFAISIIISLTQTIRLTKIVCTYTWTYPQCISVHAFILKKKQSTVSSFPLWFAFYICNALLKIKHNNSLLHCVSSSFSLLSKLFFSLFISKIIETKPSQDTIKYMKEHNIHTFLYNCTTTSNEIYF